jgi:hypothetical protein
MGHTGTDTVSLAARAALSVLTPRGLAHTCCCGAGPNGWTGGFNHGFGTVAYLSDVPEKGGGFTYWPGSHRSSHQFFLENPGFIDGSWKADGSRVWKNFWSQVRTK